MKWQLEYENSQYSRELAQRIFLNHLGECIRFPKYLQIGTVDYCNARCSMCPYSTKMAVEKHLMDEKLFDKIVKELQQYNQWIESVALYWFGEPSLDIRLKDRVKKLKEIGIKSIQISTNGYCLNEELTNDLMKAGLNDLRFSIDSIDKETYEKIRGLSYEQVIKNILDAIKIRNEYYPEVTIRIRLTEMPDNEQEVGAFKKYWKEMLGGGIRYRLCRFTQRKAGIMA